MALLIYRIALWSTEAIAAALTIYSGLRIDLDARNMARPGSRQQLKRRQSRGLVWMLVPVLTTPWLVIFGLLLAASYGLLH